MCGIAHIIEVQTNNLTINQEVSNMSTVFYRHPTKKTWFLISVNYNLSIAREYAVILRNKGFEAFASNRGLRNHLGSILRRHKYAIL